MAEAEAQAATVAFLEQGDAYGRAVDPVVRIDTHAARIFLVGRRAFKMKRAVRYSFLDFTSLESRRAALEAELRLNRRTAPALYRRVLPVTREAGGRLALDGTGQPAEWLLEMARFRQEDLLDSVARRHGLDDALLERLAGAIVAFHGAAEVREDQGGYPGLAAVVEGNARDLRGLAGEVFEPAEVERIERRSSAEIERHRDLLEARRAAGRVRHCHGDLHLGNIVLVDGEPVLFDCIEFDEALACTDVLYDLAFLLMDLIHRDLRPEAQHLLGCYLELDPDDEGLALLPLFQAVRATIRAKVAGLAATGAADREAAAAAREEARRYLELARDLLDPPPPRLIALGGLSGSGKSTIARALAPAIGAAPGAVVLRSDRLRKRLFGADPTTRLGPEAYTEEISSRVYEQIATRAERLLRAGHAVIADAVFASPLHRARIEQAAARAKVAFAGLWLEAPRQALEARIAARRGDASDATVGVLHDQLRDLDTSGIPWRRVDARGGIAEALDRTRAALDP